MKQWRPMPSAGGVLAFVGALLALGLALAAMARIGSAILDVSAASDFSIFLLGLAALGLLGLCALFVYWTVAFFRMRYRLDRNAVVILWGGRRHNIPMNAITRVEPVSAVLNRVRKAMAEGKTILPEHPLSIAQTPEDTDSGTGQSSFERFEAAFRDAPFQMPQTMHGSATGSSRLKSLLDAPVDVDNEPVAAHGQLRQVTPGALPAPTRSAEADFADFPAALSVTPTTDDEPIEPFDPDEEFEMPSAHGTAEHIDELPLVEGEGQSADARIDASQARRVSFAATVRGINWPGYHVGRGSFGPVGEVIFYTTTPFARALLVHTAKRAYAISPSDPQAFMREYTLRRNLGQLQPVTEGRQDGWLTGHPLWRDRFAWWLLGLGVVAATFLFAFLFLRYTELPDTLRIHFDRQGQPDRIGGREDLFWLPVIGAAVFCGNTFLGFLLQPRDRVIARLLYGVSLVALGLLWLAVLGIIATATRTINGG